MESWKWEEYKSCRAGSMTLGALGETPKLGLYFFFLSFFFFFFFFWGGGGGGVIKIFFFLFFGTV
jgi:hypothetical protein